MIPRLTGHEVTLTNASRMHTPLLKGCSMPSLRGAHAAWQIAQKWVGLLRLEREIPATQALSTLKLGSEHSQSSGAYSLEGFDAISYSVMARNHRRRQVLCAESTVSCCCGTQKQDFQRVRRFQDCKGGILFCFLVSSPIRVGLKGENKIHDKHLCGLFVFCLASWLETREDSIILVPKYPCDWRDSGIRTTKHLSLSSLLSSPLKEVFNENVSSEFDQFNPFRAPRSLPILIPSTFVTTNGFRYSCLQAASDYIFGSYGNQKPLVLLSLTCKHHGV